MADWIGRCAVPDLHGGFRDRSPTDATWVMGMRMEAAHSSGRAVSASATDIYKCFDQVSRQVIYLLAIRAGAPRG
eukprot:12905783-Alexandrium_andersonii.AAC.1